MKLNAKIQDLENKGVYIIKNLTTNKFYIGSTSKNLAKRIKHHQRCLIRNEHKNTYLQNAYNKYGDDDFIVEILEICENSLEREQYYLDTYDAIHKGYNINPLASGTPNMSLETLLKRKNSISITHGQAAIYNKQLKNNEITINDIPKKYLKMIYSFLEHREPWNKGKTYGSTDHLKVPKKIKGNRENYSKAVLKKQPMIQVFDEFNNFLGEWKNSTELSNESMSSVFKLNPYLKIRNKEGRNGYPYHYLAKFNIKKSCFYNYPYKGLYFKIKPLSTVM